MNGEFYLTKEIVSKVEKGFPELILRRLKNIVKKYVYGIKKELRTRRVVISIEFNCVSVSLQVQTFIKQIADENGMKVENFYKVTEIYKMS